MKKTAMKLAIACVFLLVAVSMTAVASFAWMTLSDSPAVEGLYIAISGGNIVAVETTPEDAVLSMLESGNFDNQLIVNNSYNR